METKDCETGIEKMDYARNMAHYVSIGRSLGLLLHGCETGKKEKMDDAEDGMTAAIDKDQNEVITLEDSTLTQDKCTEIDDHNISGSDVSESPKKCEVEDSISVAKPNCDVSEGNIKSVNDHKLD